MNIKNKIRLQEGQGTSRNTQVFVSVEVDEVPCGEVCIASIPTEMAKELIDGNKTLKQIQEKLNLKRKDCCRTCGFNLCCQDCKGIPNDIS